MPRDERLLRGIAAAISNDTAPFARGLDCPVAGWPERNERSFTMMNQADMMNHTGGWMSGWTGGAMWILAVVGVLVVVLVGVVIMRMSRKPS